MTGPGAGDTGGGGWGVGGRVTPHRTISSQSIQYPKVLQKVKVKTIKIKQQMFVRSSQPPAPVSSLWQKFSSPTSDSSVL